MRGMRGELREPGSLPQRRGVTGAAVMAAMTFPASFSASSSNFCLESRGGIGGHALLNLTTSSRFSYLTSSTSTKDSAFTSTGAGGMAMMTDAALRGVWLAHFAWKGRSRRQTGGANCVSSFLLKSSIGMKD